MESLKLTKEQREKLLEMAKSLYPEWYEIMWGRKYAPDTDYLWFSEKYIHPETKVEMANLTQTMHWYMFCILHLATKIFNLNNIKIDGKHDITLFRGYIAQDVDHPIDYLYEKFKELK